MAKMKPGQIVMLHRSGAACFYPTKTMELREFCVNHHQLLHEDFQQLSPLSQLMRRHCPEVLIQCLIALHDIGTIPLDLAIKLLQGPSGYEEIHQNAHLKEYLELLINDEQRKYVFEDAVKLKRRPGDP